MNAIEQFDLSIFSVIMRIQAELSRMVWVEWERGADKSE